jgi:hypothetical protein
MNAFEACLLSNLLPAQLYTCTENCAQSEHLQMSYYNRVCAYDWLEGGY